MSQQPTLLQRFQQARVVPVIVVEDAQDIIPLGHALADNGLPLAEITLRSGCAVEAIRLLRQARPDMLVGAGTLQTTQQITQAIDAGAMFGVSAGLNPKNARFCQQQGLPLIPGVNNPMAIECALELDIDFVKFFPAEASGGVKMLKALQGPYAQLKIMPTGGINLSNIHHYLALPQVVACGGSWMVDPALIKAKDWQQISRLVQQTVAQVAR